MGRYEILTKGNAEYYMAGCPIILQSYAVISDSEKKQILAQFKFSNISVRVMKKVIFDVECMRADGTCCEGVRQCSYSIEEIKSHEVFGNNVPFYLPDAQTREVRIKYIKVIFMDGGIWENLDSECFQALPKKELIRNTLEKALYERFMQQQASGIYPEAIYVPWKRDGIWQCACGTYNMEDSVECFHCNEKYDAWNEKLNSEQLQSAQQKHIELKKIEVEQEIEKIKGVRTIKMSAVIMIIAVVVLIVGAIIFVPIGKYMWANNLMNKGEYTAALEIYEGLDGYRDSLDKAEEVKTLKLQDWFYNKGVDEFEANEYDSAVTTLSLAVEYKDARKYLNKAAYALGMDYYKKENYRDASRTWNHIDDQSMLNELEQEIEVANNYRIYEEGVRLAGSGKIQSAIYKLEEVENEIEEASDLKEKLNEALQNWFVGSWEIKDVNPDNEMFQYMYIWPIYADGEIKYVCPFLGSWELVNKSFGKGFDEIRKYLLQDASLVLEGEEDIKINITREGDEVRNTIEHSGGNTRTELYKLVSKKWLNEHLNSDSQ